jgi:hypothetical protein
MNPSGFIMAAGVDHAPMVGRDRVHRDFRHKQDGEAGHIEA